MALHDHAIKLGEKGMRILRFPLVRLVIAISIIILSTTAAYLAALIISKLAGPEPFKYFKNGLETIFLCIFSIWFYWIYVSLFEGRKPTELSGSTFLPQLGIGLLLGLVFISIIIFVISILGGYKITGRNEAVVMVPVLLMALKAGVFEEILTRGALFRIAEDGLGTWWSVILSALIFGFLHIWNPNATVFSSLSIAMTAGVILALFYVLTRRLWIPIGIHIAWNFTLGGIYGAPVSGGNAQGLFKSEMLGPEIITGGGFGPEASIVTVIFFLIVGAIMIWRVVKTDTAKKPMWAK